MYRNYKEKIKFDFNFFNKKHSNNLTKMNKENIRNKNIGRRNEINTNKKNKKNKNINKKACMLILNRYPKRMQPK